jgi:hypothetical protein
MNIGQIMAQRKDLTKRQTAFDVSEAVGIGRMLPAMPLVVRLLDKATAIVQRKTGDDSLFVMTDVANDPNARLTVYLIIGAVRDVFLQATSDAEILEFLSMFGFRERTSALVEDRLLLSNFRDWQIIVRHMMTSGPLPDGFWNYATMNGHVAWINHKTSDATIRELVLGLTQGKRVCTAHPVTFEIGPGESGNPDTARLPIRAEILVGSVLEGILAETFLDGLSGTHYQLCGAHDCGRVFELSSKHDRQYCTQA